MIPLRSLACSRLVLCGAFCLAVCILGFSLYIQQHHAIIPCPLCILQRYGFFCVAIFSGIGLFVPRRMVAFFAVMTCVCAVIGLALSSWHIYVQARPSHVALCGIGFERLLNRTVLAIAFPKVFASYGDCGIIPWRFHTITLPMLSTGAFVLHIVLSVWSLRLNHRSCLPNPPPH